MIQQLLATSHNRTEVTVVQLAARHQVRAQRLTHTLFGRALCHMSTMQLVERLASALGAAGQPIVEQPCTRRCDSRQREADAARGEAQPTMARRVDAQPPARRLPHEAQRTVRHKHEQQANTHQCRRAAHQSAAI